MNQFNRRNFIKATSAGIFGFAIEPVSFLELKKKIPRLSFSTLGCPDWSFDKILDFAVAHQYKAIEFRGILRQLDLTKCIEFSTPENIAASLKKIKDKKLQVINLGCSSELHFAEGAERTKNLEGAKNFIQLAQQLNCPYIRVFPNKFPATQSKKESIDLIIKGLVELGNFGEAYNVSVLMETHGDVIYTEDIKNIIELANHKNVGLIWDVVNMWTGTKEPVAAVYHQLKKHIRHVHIKDVKLMNDKERFVVIGKGDTPIFEAISVLKKDGYKGFYSFEWEKLWHPDIEEPEFALDHYSRTMQQLFL